MKKILFAIAAVATLFATSCKKESVNPAVDVPEGAFVCTIDNGAVQNIIASGIKDDMGKMTTIPDGRNVFWKVNDVIHINGVAYNATTVTNGQATFTTTETEPTPTYYAFYGDNLESFNADGATLKSTFAYDKDNNAANLPLYATGSGKTLTFSNICAVLEIKMPAACNKIVLSANENIAGPFSVVDNKAVLAATGDGLSNTITVNGYFTENQLVYVAIPAGTYNNFQIRLYNNGTSPINSPTTKTVTFEANKIYPVTLKIIPADGFCFTALTAAGAQVSLDTVGDASSLGCTFEYATILGNDTSDWTTYTVGTTKPITLTNVGDKVYFRAGTNGNNTVASSRNSCFHIFTSTDRVSVSGDITYLLDQNKKSSLDDNNRYAFMNLFRGMTNLTDASGLKLVDNGSSAQPRYCYAGLFYGCSGLDTVFSTLPSQTLGSYDYMDMFNGCSELTTAITIGATTLSTKKDFLRMFQNCEKLSSVTLEVTDATKLKTVNFEDWLNGAGTDQSVTSKTIYVKNTAIKNWFDTTDSGKYKYGWTVKVIGSQP